MNDSERYLARAARTLAVAELLNGLGHTDVAASRVYYAAFYVATALFRAQGLRFTRHSWLIAEYGRQFARTRELDPQFHRLLRISYELRIRADYWPEPDIEAAEVSALIAEGRHFLAAARAYLATKP